MRVRGKGIHRQWASFLALAIIAMLSKAPAARADLMATVLNSAAPKWAAIYYTADVSPTGLPGFNVNTATQLKINDTFQPSGKEIDVEDPLGNDYFGELSLTINLDGHGNATGGSINEDYSPDGNGDDLQTVYSSSTLLGFGQFVGTGGSADYWLAFANPAFPGTDIGGLITPSDVKTFVVPEPSGMLALAAATFIFVLARWGRISNLAASPKRSPAFK